MLHLEINIDTAEQQITLSGKLTGLEALDFRQSISTVLKDNVGIISLNIQDVIDLDLTGFNAIVMLKKEVENSDRRFQLISKAEGPIDEFLHLTKLDLNKTIASS